MNYLLHYSGNFPIYGFKCFEAINIADPLSTIFFCGDENNNFIDSVFLNDIKDEMVNEVISLEYYKGVNNSLWINSLLRIFYIRNLAKSLNINEFIHFDLDVIVYKPFEELESQFKLNKINITPGNESNIIFGYSYINDLSILDEACEEIIEIIKYQDVYERKFYNNKTLNEMEILNILYHKKPYLFNLLNTTVNTSKIIFDANSYGQYLGGLPSKPLSKYYINSSHYSGRSMIELGIRPKFKNKRPYLEFNKQKHEIVNLHIHSKKLYKFV